MQYKVCLGDIAFLGAREGFLSVMKNFFSLRENFFCVGDNLHGVSKRFQVPGAISWLI